MRKIIKISLVLTALLSTTVAHGGESTDESFFLKLPVTSFHIGNTGGYSFNQHNFGIGLGYEHTRYIPELGDLAVAYSVSRFIDSYRCTATNLQVRALKEWSTLAFGISLNLAHKCVRPNTHPRTFIAPLFTSAWSPTKSIRIALDGFPPVTKQYGIGFVGVSIDVDF